MPEKHVYLVPNGSADSIAALNEAYKKELCMLHDNVKKMEEIFNKHKKYCRVTNIIWCVLCVLVYVWF